MRFLVIAGLLVGGLVYADEAPEQPETSAVAALEQEVLNFYQMTDNIAIGGQPTVSQLSRIADAGYSVVVNLAMHDSDNAIAEEGSVAASLGMSYVHIPVPSDAPTSRHVRNFFGVMDSFEEEKVFVHCVVSGRVSAFMHRYMMLRKGASAEQATSPLLQRWLPNMAEHWKAILELELGEIDPPATR